SIPPIHIAYKITNYAASLITDAGKKLIKQKGARVLASKNIGHLSTNTVTQVDIDTENFLRERLVKQFPTFGFYSEESAKETQTELEKECVWVVDPIDGTLNFSRNIPLYGISVGLLYQNRPVFGIIYLPEDDELYSAHRNQGAYLGRRKLQVANRTDPKQLYAVLGHKGLSENLQGRLFSLMNCTPEDSVVRYIIYPT
ncbi:MAG: inositol monophosphatase family protein, partial [Patescibacteria group bacterium]